MKSLTRSVTACSELVTSSTACREESKVKEYPNKASHQRLAANMYAEFILLRMETAQASGWDLILLSLEPLPGFLVLPGKLLN